MNSIILATLIALNPGYNNVGVAGEVVALEAATSNATASVEVKTVSSFSTFTNATAEVVSYEPAWKVTYTNFNGEASITTNVVGYLNWDDFKWTNGVQRIIGDPVRFDMAITNEVVTARVMAETYVATNGLATITTADHFGSVVTNGYFFGGGIVVEGAEDGDSIKLLIK